MGVRIVRGEAQDVARCVPLFKDLWSRSTYAEHPLDTAETTRVMSSLVEAGHPMFMAVDDDGSIRGCITACVTPIIPGASVSQVDVFIFIAPSHQRALLGALEDFAAETPGCVRMSFRIGTLLLGAKWPIMAHCVERRGYTARGLCYYRDC